MLSLYDSEELHQILAAKTHPMETLRQHLLRVANWVLFALRTSTPSSFSASVELIGKPGGTPGPVEVEDLRNIDAPSASWGVLMDMTHTRRRGHDLPSGALVYQGARNGGDSRSRRDLDDFRIRDCGLMMRFSMR